MLLSIISFVINIAMIVILNIELYTDTAYMADGTVHHWELSPIDKLSKADMGWMFNLQIFLVAISVLSSILVLFGVKHRIVKIVQLVSLIASVVMFIIIMITSKNIHLKY
ncbi:MAG: hypothetical protein J5589_11995 [Firmicutes bacterium]|nr:hypothetical protein [Bacillota bacterium]